MNFDKEIAFIIEKKVSDDNYCHSSKEISEAFMSILNEATELQKKIIFMKYGLNSERKKYKYEEILTYINEGYDYPMSMHRLKDIEKRFFRSIRVSFYKELSVWDLECKKLKILIYEE